MTCRHRSGDPDCGATMRAIESHSSNKKDKEISKLKSEIASFTPDNTRFEIVDAKRFGPHVVLKIKYPNCKKCEFEGNKILVLLNITEIQLLRFKNIDPHFRKRTNVLNDVTRSPSPDARFPGDPEGWEDACNYAQSKIPVSKPKPTPIRTVDKSNCK